MVDGLPAADRTRQDLVLPLFAHARGAGARGPAAGPCAATVACTAAPPGSPPTIACTGEDARPERPPDPGTSAHGGLIGREPASDSAPRHLTVPPGGAGLPAASGARDVTISGRSRGTRDTAVRQVPATARHRSGRAGQLLRRRRDRGPAGELCHGRPGPGFLNARGSKLSTAEGQDVVAFEADAYDEETRSGWSVLVNGRAHAVYEDAEIRRLSDLGLRPWANAVDRPFWIRIRPTSVTGRQYTGPGGRRSGAVDRYRHADPQRGPHPVHRRDRDPDAAVARRVRGHRGHAVQGVTAVEVVRAVHRAERPRLPAA